MSTHKKLDDRTGAGGLRRPSDEGPRSQWDDDSDFGEFGRDFGYGMTDLDHRQRREERAAPALEKIAARHAAA